MLLFNRTELEAAAALVYRHMPPTPQYTWPMLNNAAGTQVWVKHENHTPTGAFKVRGGITYIDWLKRARADVRGICTATRGNHGQSQARAARGAGLVAKIYAEGAGAAPLAALLQERDTLRGKSVGVILCGGNIDADQFATVLNGATPQVELSS